MKAILRSAVLVAAAATSVAIGTSPASAEPGAVVFTGTATIDCFGCGVSEGTANLTLVGTHPGAATADFTVNEPTGVTCVVTGSASGSVSGAVAVDFNWTRVGAVAVVTVSGQVNGAGVAGFVAHVSGLPCGTQNLTADVAGVVAGV